MDLGTPRADSWPSRMVLRVSRSLKSTDKAFSTEDARKKEAKQEAKRAKKLRKQEPRQPVDRQADVNELGERQYSIFSDDSTLVDPSTRRKSSRKDNTDMLHGLAHHDSFDSLLDGGMAARDERGDDDLDPQERERLWMISEKQNRILDSLPANLWELVASYLTAADRAHLALSNQIMYQKLGKMPLRALGLPENRHDRIRFLNHLDQHLPDHLLCFHCGKYHFRIRRGSEKLMADYVANPVFDCPQVKSSVLPRTRLAHGRELPYSFVQLAIRSYQHGEKYGVTTDSLARKWKDPSSSWTHTTRYMVHDGRLFVRIRSQTWAPPKLTPTAERHLLYDREEYTPFFSVCAHWQDGELMPICKCALSHIPEQPQSMVTQLKKAPKINRSLIKPNFIVRGCDFCQPARRCPECPSEYLVEINMAEDKDDPFARFKHVIVVTRWCDLGDGSSPSASPEWCAINGILSDYASFSTVGRRAVGGIFESKMSGSIPGQRMISLNPGNRKEGESGHGWY